MWRSAGAGALLTLAIAVPLVAVVAVVAGDEADGRESNLWVVPLLVLLVAFALGGRLAARREPQAPLLHSATAAALAFAAFATYTMGRRLVTGRGLPASLLVTMVLLFQMAASVALLAGWISSRRRRGP